MDNWAALRACKQASATRRITDLFDDPARAAEFSVTLSDAATGPVHFDYSKTNIDAETRAALIDLAEASGLESRRNAMFSGEKINVTEGRAVLHTALRNLDGSLEVEGEDVMPEVRATLARMESFARDLRDGRIRGAGGRITDVVNIGIGGSDLGPAMAAIALAPFHDGPRCHFVSNVDGAHIHDVLDGIDPETTLVIVASKTFTTVETMTNAETARAWMARTVRDPARQFVALSTAQDKTTAFGIDPARVFGFEDWVGGRYSMWGPIGLSLMIAIGPMNFHAFLKGASVMDQHFLTADLAQNMPVMLALVGVWHRQVLGYPTRAVLPYDQRLARLPAYLQQLEMESNGKRVAMDGSELEIPSGPVVFGEPGTNGQHAFYQLIHQGTDIVPCEFLLAAKSHEPALAHHHRLLAANCLAQAEALMTGRSLDEAKALMKAKGFKGAELTRQAKHRVFPGNRPSTTLVYPQLTPAMLGAIVALYEHRVFVEGVVLGINSFDQWGVELGKELAVQLLPMVDGSKPAEGRDGSTQALIAALREMGI
ncbi:glucose-6-phosphate isomerase [Pararhodobacter oceanensis]|uniref:Glucose-6-phosphate isomerase n=1 Tax=Pararhodobacter oceanensis TaxID=2172121 RepID=A0A2T8HTD8_9RHOB|nr:glucose-6-phosphate isomerase [Pararhodobacter oceanensis]PVH28705.1 glucose-6-phosphate isomerase [Pararhodobacter oceanensis]